ncbi:MAG: phosphate regulon transcriptional regulator PhoB [Gammaproteobacteria bacterium]|nr:phosphate regulon transcriptional regulator PhoB [Gammaproteobacteria bacterium]MCB1923105.1 phosphate regulon transcriptional regulator PhoB [Gammaproteobacteria bacterium]
MTRILVVEDESAVRELLAATLIGAGYDVIEAANGSQAQQLVSDRDPALILLDWMLPGMSGLEFAKWMKRDERLSEIPIIMLTARDEEGYKVQGLEAGVDDYVTKPFSTRELLARIKAVLRRAGSDGSELIRIDNRLEMDLIQHRVLADDNPISIGPTEFKLLHFFLTHQERVYSRAQLLDLVWGRNVYIEERTVDVHIRRLRKALEPHHLDELVQTVRGVGYRFSVRPS